MHPHEIQLIHGLNAVILQSDMIVFHQDNLLKSRGTHTVVNFHYANLKLLKENHPAWRLLCAEHAPLIASFLHRTFVKTNERSMSEPELIERLEDELFEVRQSLGPKSFPKSARFYLTEWAAPDKRWLRKFYKPDSDDAFFDLTPHTEKALLWLDSLEERTFVGTESRLLTVFELLKQISQGSETDPTIRIEELQKQRDQIDAQIEQLQRGVVPVLEDSAIRDRFQQFIAVARELLTDFERWNRTSEIWTGRFVKKLLYGTAAREL